MTREERAFFNNHDAHPRAVYLVTIYPEERHAIFTTRAQVEDWLATQPEEGSSLIVPYVLDEPEYGNVPFREMA